MQKSLLTFAFLLALTSAQHVFPSPPPNMSSSASLASKHADDGIDPFDPFQASQGSLDNLKPKKTCSREEMEELFAEMDRIVEQIVKDMMEYAAKIGADLGEPNMRVCIVFADPETVRKPKVISDEI